MKKIKKLITILTTLIGTAVPITGITSCSKSPDKPTADITFSVVNPTMISSTKATMDLDWTPSENNLEFSNWKFIYENSKEVLNIATFDPTSRPQHLTLTFSEDILSNITDGKLSFHCKDKTLQKEYDTSINNIKIDKYQAPTKLIGGSLNLTGIINTAGADINKWKLMKNDQEITDGVTMSIVPVSSSTGQFPEWITLDSAKESSTYHHVIWSELCTQGTYKFKVSAKYETNTFESSEITLEITSENRYTPVVPTKIIEINRVLIQDYMTMAAEYQSQKTNVSGVYIKDLFGNDVTDNCTNITAKILNSKHEDIDKSEEKVHYDKSSGERKVVFDQNIFSSGNCRDTESAKRAYTNTLQLAYASGDCTCEISFEIEGKIVVGSFTINFLH